MTWETEDKRQQILAAATRVFAARGYHQAKIADIAAAAGVGKGTVYEYYASKKDLFQQMLLHLFTSYLAYLKKISAEQTGLEVFLQRLLRSSLDYFWENREIAGIIMSTPPSLDSRTQALFIKVKAEIDQCLSSHLQAAIERGEMRPLPPGLLAAMLTGLAAALNHYLALNQQFSATEKEPDLDAIVVQAVDFIMNGVAIR